MSRTRRNHEAQAAFGHAYIGIPDHKFGRDKKTGPASWWKRMRRRIRKAREKMAVHLGLEPPRFRHDDKWGWW